MSWYFPQAVLVLQAAISYSGTRSVPSRWTSVIGARTAARSSAERASRRALEPVTEAEPNVAANPLADEYKAVFHLTRTWVQYGVFGFAVLCIVIGAVEALFGR